MRLMSRLLLAIVLGVSSWMVAQQIPPLAVTPSAATVLAGDARYFRAVDRDGHPAQFVRWDVNSPNAHISGSGSDVVVEFEEAGEYTVHAYSVEGSASASVHVLNYRDFPAGTKKWTLESFEGCRTVAVKPVMPTRTAENFGFMQDECPRGMVIRDFTEDGRENWRTWVLGQKDIDPEHLEAYEPKALLAKSLCDNVKPDMSRDDVLKLAAAAKLHLPESEKPKDLWTFEENGAECRVTFKDGKVLKKQKVIEN